MTPPSLPPAAPPVLLADYTTLGLGGPARDFVSAGTERELIDAVRAADAAGAPVLLIGGGSNLVIADAGFDGTVIHVNTRGLRHATVSGSTVSGSTVSGRTAPATDGTAPGEAVDVTVAAGEDWDGVVAATVADGLAGLEPLSGIPGRAGATPIQNVGAYGREVAEVITAVRVYDRRENDTKVIPNECCGFSYRTSLFKRGQPESLVRPPGGGPAQPRYVVLDATFRLARQPLSAPVRYSELAAELGIALGQQAAAGEVRAAVVKIRSRKGMVLSPGDPDTRSAGSFFTNPVISAADFGQVAAAAVARDAGPVPHYPAGDGLVKVPAGWLIEHSGFAKGYGAPAPARVSAKHTLALVNTGNATAAELLGLAREIVAGVRAAYGVTLTPEPILVGLSL